MKNVTHRLCAHIKTNGERCQAIALKDDNYCYFHSRDRQRMLVIERFQRSRVERLNAGMPANECHKQNAFNNDLFNECSAALLHALELPVLEDAAAIQVTVTNIIRMIALQQIDRASAGLILYGLQIASGTLNRLRTEPVTSLPRASHDPEPLREIATMLANLRQAKRAAMPTAHAEPASDETEEEITGT